MYHFLSNLLRQLRGPLVILWDRGSVHRDSRVIALIRRHPRLHSEFLPAYAPELNPAEYVWNQTDSALANSAPRSTKQLDHRLRRIGCRLRSSQKLLRACFHASELPWTD